MERKYSFQHCTCIFLSFHRLTIKKIYFALFQKNRATKTEPKYFTMHHQLFLV